MDFGDGEPAPRGSAAGPRRRPPPAHPGESGTGSHRIGTNHRRWPMLFSDGTGSDAPREAKRAVGNGGPRSPRGWASEGVTAPRTASRLKGRPPEGHRGRGAVPRGHQECADRRGGGPLSIRRPACDSACHMKGPSQPDGLTRRRAGTTAQVRSEGRVPPGLVVARARSTSRALHRRRWRSLNAKRKAAPRDGAAPSETRH